MVFSLIGGILGSSVARAFGAGVIGKSIGWLGGTLLAGLLFGKKEEEPRDRLQEILVSIAGEGTRMNRGYGTHPMGGLYIWALPVRETVITKRVGGFLFFRGQKVPVRTERFLTCHILIEPQKIKGVKRIWADDLLVADFRENPDPEAAEATAIFLRHSRMYFGEDDQQPDLWAQEVIGEGAVPAYRGWAYISLKDYPIYQLGNTPPTYWRFETVGDEGTYDRSTWTDVTPVEITRNFSPRAQHGAIVYDPRDGAGEYLYVVGGTTDTVGLNLWNGGVWRTGTGTLWNPTLDIPLQEFFNVRPAVLKLTNDPTSPDFLPGVSRSVPHMVLLGGQEGNVTYIEPMSGGYRTGFVFDGTKWIDLIIDETRIGTPDAVLPRDSYGACSWYPDSKTQDNTNIGTEAIVLTGGVSNPANNALQPPGGDPGGHYNDAWISGNGGLSFTRLTADPDAGISYRFNHTTLIFKGVPWVIGGDVAGASTHNHVLAFDPAARTFVFQSDLTNTVTPPLGDGDVWGAVVDGDELVCFLQTPGLPMRVVHSSDGINWEEYNVTGLQEYVLYPAFAAFKGRLYILGGEGDTAVINTTIRTEFPKVESGQVSLSDVFFAEVSRIPMLASNLDLFDMTEADTTYVDGCTFSDGTTLDQLVDLFMVYGFDLIEEQGQIKAKKRGIHTGETINIESFGVDSIRQEQAITQLEVAIEAQNDVPVGVDFGYYDAINDYSTGIQSSFEVTQRPDGSPIRSQQSSIRVTVPVVLSDDFARTTATFILWDAMVGRHKIPLTATFSNYRFSTGDVFDLEVTNIDDQVRVYTVRIDETTMRSKSILEFNVTIENVDIYTELPGKGVPSEDQPYIPIPAGQGGQYQLIDTRIMDVKDWSDYGFFFIASPNKGVTNWGGVQLYGKVSERDGFQPVSDVVDSVTPMGIVTDASNLRSDVFAGYPDKVSTLDVQITSEGELLSSGLYELTANNSNLCFVGKSPKIEILSFAKVQILDPDLNIYRISEFLRGRYGTDIFMGDHENGEPFVRALNLQRITAFQEESNEIPVEFKVVGVGQSEIDVDSFEWTNSGYGVKSLPPSYPRLEELAGELVSGFYTIHWHGRSRFVLNKTPVLPLDRSDINKYRIEFYSDDTFQTKVFEDDIEYHPLMIPKTTISLAAQQHYFGSLQDDFHVKIYSLSDYYYSESEPLQATLSRVSII